MNSTTSAPLNPSTLPDGNVNSQSYCYDLRGEFFMQKGAMIAYYGSMRFEPLNATSVPALVASQFSSPLYASQWVLATGNGKLIVGDRGYDLNSFDLEDGNLTIRAANLLGFEAGLELKQSIVPGFLTLIGTGKFLASSNGPVIFAEPPMRIDPEALVGWADCPSPSHHYDANWMRGFFSTMRGMLGRASGEERQFDFTGAGTILMQSSEAQLDDESVLGEVLGHVDTLGANSLRRVGARVNERLNPQ